MFKRAFFLEILYNKKNPLLSLILFCLLLTFRIDGNMISTQKSIDIENNIPKTELTLVSAFLSNINQRTDRNIENYVEWSQYLLKCNIPKLIFIEYLIYDLYYKENNINGLYPQTRFIYIERDSLSLNSYKHQITHFNICTSNPRKDTLDYILMQCYKTEWVNQAINLNVFASDQYVWVDFGLYHVFKDPKVFENSLYSLQNKSYKNVRIGGCWDLEETPESKDIDIYKSIGWYFAGGVFGGHKDDLVLFNNLVMEKCEEIILHKKSIMWEVNIWYLVYLENKELFNIYLCNHDSSILKNY